MNKFNKINVIALHTAFTNEMAARYDMPELTNEKHHITVTPGKAEEEFTCTLADRQVQPRGQMAGLVKALSVSVTVWTGEGRARGELRMRYSHHGGGSNGNEQRFAIVLESAFGEPEYSGCLDETLLYRYEGSRRE